MSSALVRTLLRRRTGEDGHEYVQSRTVHSTANPLGGCATYYHVKGLPMGAEGSIGIVRSTLNHHPFVVKSLRTDAVTQKNKLPAEIGMLRALSVGLNHRGIIQVWNVFHRQDTQQVDIFQQFCDGGDLRDQLIYYSRTFHERMPALITTHAFVQLASAIAFIHHGIHHRRGLEWDINEGHQAIIHGDLKPENIVLRWSNIPEVEGLPDFVITDFGHANFESKFRVYGGTPDYLPPEATKNHRRARVESIMLGRSGFEADLLAEQFYNLPNEIAITTSADIYVFGLIIAELILGVFVPAGTLGESLIMDEDDGAFDCLYYVQRCLRKKPYKRLLVAKLPTSATEPLEQPDDTLLFAIDHIAEIRDALKEHQGDIPQRWWTNPRGSVNLRLIGPTPPQSPRHWQQLDLENTMRPWQLTSVATDLGDNGRGDDYVVEDDVDSGSGSDSEDDEA